MWSSLTGGGCGLVGATTVPPNPEVEQQLVHPGKVRRHDDPMDLVHLAQSVMKADQFVRATTHGKLTVVVDQIRALQAMVGVANTHGKLMVEIDQIRVLPQAILCG